MRSQETTELMIRRLMAEQEQRAHAERAELEQRFLTEQAEHIGRTELGERLLVIASGDELERLSLSLNRMIDTPTAQ